MAEPKTRDCLKKWLDGRAKKSTMNSVVEITGKIQLCSWVYRYYMVAFDKRPPFFISVLTQVLPCRWGCLPFHWSHFLIHKKDINSVVIVLHFFNSSIYISG
jgi:hypothetical protein